MVHFVYRHRGVRSGAPRLGADPTPGFLRWRCCDRAPERGTRLSRKAVPAHRARSVHPGAVREERGARAFPPGAAVDYEDTPLAEHVLRPVRADYEPCLPGLLVPWPLPRSETAPSGCDFRRCEPATESRIGGPVPQSRPAPTVPRGTCPAVLWCAGSDGDQRAWAVSPRPFCTVRGVLFAISGGAEPLGILFCDPSVAADKQHGGGSHPRLVREIECHVVHIPGPESARPLASLPPLRTPASPTTRHGR